DSLRAGWDGAPGHAHQKIGPSSGTESEDTLTLLCLCHLASKWRLFSHICMGRSDSRPTGTKAEAAVSPPKSRRN
ncbi:hypothetical protein NQZ68_039341, partial [Dissostichus eleginoides]